MVYLINMQCNVIKLSGDMLGKALLKARKSGKRVGVQGRQATEKYKEAGVLLGIFGK
jgi:hypothetical protein